MSKVKNGDKVKVHYKGTLSDGAVFDSSEGRDPLEFTIGSGQVIPGFDNMLMGMSVGEEKTETIPCDQAYGPYRDELKVQIEKSQFPDDFDLKVGVELLLQNDQGQNIPAKIVKIEDDKVSLDMNNPLAGEDLTFAITLQEIVAE